LSFAGLPLTAGFFGKLYVLSASVGGRKWALVAALAASSAIGPFYYLRVMIAMLRRREIASEPTYSRRNWSAAIAIAVLVATIVGLGLNPA
jgi:NADH-quinone oxidoreductase subunit N